MDTDAYTGASRISSSNLHPNHPKLVRSQNQKNEIGKECSIYGREVRYIQDFNGDKMMEGNFLHHLNRRPCSVRL
jgi:hypothetical protein